MGTSLGFFKANDLKFLYGDVFSEKEYLNSQNVIVVTDKFCEDYYGDDYSNVLGKELLVDINNQSVSYTIVGVYEYDENSEYYMSNNVTSAYIPLTTAQLFNHSKNYASFSIVTKIGVDSSLFAEEVKGYLNGFYRNNPYFEVTAFTMSSFVSILSDMMGTITMAIAIIAGIALLVGGIGVMNIMLVSITERTKEIGTRKALGATNGNIRIQFIIQAMIICLIGGAIGVLFGLLLGYIGATLLDYPANPSISSIILSLCFSLAIGVFFGYYPANKAAKMNPIDALRYE